MNTLSWIVYFAPVAPKLSAVFFSTALVAGLLAALWLICAIGEDIAKPPKWLVALVVFSALIASLIPSERAIYMIAASEIGDVVAQSAEAQEVLELLKGRIMRELSK
jgi:hypothetical protein